MLKNQNISIINLKKKNYLLLFLFIVNSTVQVVLFTFTSDLL